MKICNSIAVIKYIYKYIYKKKLCNNFYTEWNKWNQSIFK